MSAFALSVQQQEFVRLVREIAESELLGLVGTGTPGRVNRDLVRAMGKQSLLARLYSGADDSRSAAAMDLCLLRETLATVSTEAETALALQGLGSYPILLSGTREAAKRWRPHVLSGEAVAAFALSESEAGSDAGALSLRAEPDGDGWRLHGEKLWISNAPDADVYSVFARTTPNARARGVTAFVVSGSSSGLSGEHLDMISPHPIGRLHFDGVRVGPEDVLGEVDAGFEVAMRTLDLFRPSVGAFALGMAQSALDTAIAHTTSRQAFGGVLSDQQAVSHKLADMATRLEAARLLVYSAASAYDAEAEPTEITRRSAMAKLEATEAAQFVVDTAVQLVGARALQHGHPLEHLYRDVRAPRIYEGASEIQRTIIGRSLTR
ncbi:acyl-CoA dehydrogenase family protein [Haloactinomyces albus]|uniref:Alkylation response protein AidB-like acyl-CoA dehydrogenase n=1 Tax=Haloactinomyces albus TaxID=1352928 RepID=A0AAE3ZEN6_9ACTN|nr:acyl-CoA dehydrogenase family protein [Haloactinomyces albus]MDR7303558.1 alkylation response protein AidB-like acyl-CoA dehydrogenase [Haloactinomyces albus]